MGALVDGARKGDTAVLQYSGHGSFVPFSGPTGANASLSGP